MKERYNKQVFYKGKIGAWDAIKSAVKWLFTGSGTEERQDAMADRAYKYYPAAKTNITTETTTPLFSFSDGHVGNAVRFNANTEDATKAAGYSDDDENAESALFIARLSTLYQMSDQRVDNYLATTTSSGCLDPKQFYSKKNSVSALKATVNISESDSSRVVTRLFKLNPEDYKTKHDRVMFIAKIISGLGSLIFMGTPVGAVLFAIYTASLIESAVADNQYENTSAFAKNKYYEAKAEMFNKMFGVENEVIKITRVSENFIDSFMEGMLS